MNKAIKIIVVSMLVVILIPIIFMGVLYGALSFMLVDGLVSRAEIIQMYEKNEDQFFIAAEKADFAALEKIQGVQKVTVKDNCVEIACGGAGMGSNTSYFGIFYSVDDNLYAVWCAPAAHEKLVPQRNGYHWNEEEGDNEYYVENLGNHYFYFESKF